MRDIDQAIQYLLLKDGDSNVDGVTEELEFESADGFIHNLSYITGLLKEYEKTAVALTIHIPLAGESQPSSCKVVWATNKPATTILQYRVNGESEWIPFIDDETLTRYHSVLLTGLAINTLYDIWVRSEIAETSEYVEAFIWALTTGTAIIISAESLFILYGGKVLSNHKMFETVTGWEIGTLAEEGESYEVSNIFTDQDYALSSDAMAEERLIGGTTGTSCTDGAIPPNNIPLN